MAPKAPKAARRPNVLRQHGDERVDNYYWLRERDNPEVREYLEAENAYTKSVLAHTEALRQQLYEEIVSRIKQTDESAPTRKGPYAYTTRTVEGLQYPIHSRRPIDRPDETTVLLDENELAKGYDFFDLGGLSVTPDHQLLAFSTDVTGGERFTLRLRVLDDGRMLSDEVPDTYYGLAWANDNVTIFYVRPDEAVRPWQVWRHRLGTPLEDDVLVYQENDDRFFVSLGRTRSSRYLVISCDSKMTSEVRVINADQPTTPPRLIAERRQGVEYSIDHHTGPDGDRFFIVTNDDDAHNFKLMVAPADTPSREHWSEVLPHDPDVRLDDVNTFASHLVLSERAGGLERLRVMQLRDGELHTIELPDPVYSVWVGANREFATNTLRYEYTSLVTPLSSYDYDVDARSATLVKRQPVLGDFDPALYTSERQWANASDGTKVPLSIVYRRDVVLDGTAPALLYGYGSYEHSIDPTFSSIRLSLLDRGVVFAIAHVRGGGELGRHWYEHGKLAHKPNTFTDFITCAEYLVAQHYTSPYRLAARGGSAGGLLMGAVANLRPDLFRAIVAEVPFVDALTTMLDERLPLTVTEWEEWGNPLADAETYRLMKSYSPYDNVETKAYPAMLVTAGLNDPRVQYWEPAKWVAKLRATKTDNRLLALKTEMGAGHMGPSGRYDAWRDEAFVLAFVLDQLSVA